MHKSHSHAHRQRVFKPFVVTAGCLPNIRQQQTNHTDKLL